MFHPAAFGAGEADAVIAGGFTTVNCTALLVVAATMIDKLPLLAPAGTGTVIEVALQLVGIACVPLNVTELVPCDAPKFAPVIVMEAPGTPLLAERFVMRGSFALASVRNAAICMTHGPDTDRLAVAS